MNSKRFWTRALPAGAAGAVVGVGIGWLASQAASPYLIGAAVGAVTAWLVWRSWGRILPTP